MSVEIFFAYKITEWEIIASEYSDVSGRFSYEWEPSMIGEFEVAAYFDGNNEYENEASNVLNLEVTKYTSTLTCLAASTSIAEGQSITITGALDPFFRGETITLRYQPPSGSAITRTVTTDNSGEYSDTYTPSTTGSWTVTASWAGDSTHNEVSASRSFTVGGSGCLVATATFGSELTPQVQFLRSFRDNRVLATFAGRQFMEAFNSFYYSWSPNVADSIRASESFGTAMKVILYPLISILQISEELFTILSFNSEVGVITAGFIASALLAAIYLTPLAFLISYLRKYRPSTTVIAALGLIWVASLTAIGLAEATQTSALMMTSASTFVLTTMGLSILTIVRYTPQIITPIFKYVRAIKL
jgi:hypothetical protein